jgi:hypothetical protein
MTSLKLPEETHLLMMIPVTLRKVEQGIHGERPLTLPVTKNRNQQV